MCCIYIYIYMHIYIYIYIYIYAYIYIYLYGEVRDQIAAALAEFVVVVVGDALARLEDRARDARQHQVEDENGGVQRALRQ